MVNSRDKGKRGELELSKELQRLFQVPCRRGQQYSGIGGDDVVGLPGLHVECKRTETLSIYQAMEQAMRDAKEGDVPMVCHRRNHEGWLAVLYLEDLPHVASLLTKLHATE